MSKYKQIHAADIYVPGADPGLICLGAPPRPWVDVAGADIGSIGLSDHSGHNELARGILHHYQSVGRFSRALEFATVLCVTPELKLHNGLTRINGQTFLCGPQGLHLREALIEARPEKAGERFEADLVERLSQLAKAPQMNAPLAHRDLEDGDLDLDLVVNCHDGPGALMEVLCNMMRAHDIGLRGGVHIYSDLAGLEHEARPFIAELFADLAPQVVFSQKTPQKYVRALIAYNLMAQYFMCGDGMIAPVDAFVPASRLWQGHGAGRLAWRLLAQNAYDRDLARLRDHARARITPQDLEGLPHRIYVTHDRDHPNTRPVRGEKQVRRHLEKLGFVPVCLEALGPKQQIAHMMQANGVVMAHGPNLTRMMFANPETQVFELAHAQIASHCFGQFHSYAHVAGCQYISLICDHKGPTPDLVAQMHKHGPVGVALSHDGVRRLCDVLRALGGTGGVGDVPATARRLRESGNDEALQVLLEQNGAAIAQNPDLLVWRANARAQAEEFPGALHDLVRAWRLAPDRMGLLERVIRLANRLHEFTLARELMAEHGARFPQRQPEFLQDCGWLAHLLEPDAPDHD